jgi:hypothetical protein
MGACAKTVACIRHLEPRYYPRFKGTDTTFASFPARLQHVLSDTIDNITAECIVFPAYETKGELVSLFSFPDLDPVSRRELERSG